MNRKFFARTAFSALCLSLLFGQAAVAADTPLSTLTSSTFAGVSFAMATPAVVRPEFTLAEAVAAKAQRPAAPAVLTGSRPKALPILYASLATLNVLDALTTSKGLSHGAVEKNPFMKGVASSSAAMLAVKAGGTAVSIWMAERLWKTNRLAAIATMVAINAATGFVVLNNQKVINRIR